MPPRRRPNPQPPQILPDNIDVISIGTDSRPTSSGASSVVVTGERVAPSRRRPPEQRTRAPTSGSGRGKGRGRRRNAAEVDPGVEEMEIYGDMVREAVAEESVRNLDRNMDRIESGGSGERASKKRKILPEIPSPTVEPASEDDASDQNYGEGGFNSSDSEEGSEESDADWEDVDLGVQPVTTADVSEASSAKNGPLELVLEDKSKRKEARPGRQKITAVERRIRLEVHKMHLMCLVYHVYLRSRWCNDSTVKKNLKPLMSEKSFAQLNHDPTDQQYRRSQLFLDGLRGATDTWRKRFKIVGKGLSYPYWKDLATLKRIPPTTNSDGLLTKAKFIAASTTLKGSRDLGSQLFCAFLRSVGVTCRLVCSLQVLPFSFMGKHTPSKAVQSQQSDTENTSDDGAGIQINPSPGSSTLRPRRSGGLRRPHLQNQTLVPKPPKPVPKQDAAVILESDYPVFWVEAWCAATQKWIAVDPLATVTVNKPHKLEPPLSDPENTMAYVIAFEEEGQARDVTRRYAKNFSGKTRKLRVSSTKGGQQWWDKVLGVFDRGYEYDRDQVEDAELLQKEVSEPIPNNIQDLKDHPLFALKRHLKRNEVIHPERKVGQIAVGKSRKKTTETIYRRRDVKIVKSSEQWYRVGRDVKPDEMPLKRAQPRKISRRRGAESEQEQDEGPVDMFAEYQTTLYEPPPVVDGMIPKNRYGNLDVFVPSMIPKGAIHMPYKEAIKAARLLGIDYAEAITGFDFKNRQATAVKNGVIIAREYRPAIEAILEAYAEEKDEAEALKRSIESLKLWRRFLLRLRIREQVNADYGEESKPHINRTVSSEAERVVPKPGTADSEGGFVPEDDNNEGGGFVLEEISERSGGFENEEQGGGFVTEEGGGFTAEDMEEMIDVDPDMDNEEYDMI